MIQKFRRKTTLILITILWGILFGILVTINLLNRQSNLTQTRRLLIQQVNILESEEESDLLPPIVDGKELTSIYTVVMDEEGELTVIFCPDSQKNRQEELIDLAENILSLNQREGITQQIRYSITKQGTQTYISFLDYNIWRQQEIRMLVYSAIIAVVGAVLLLGAAVALTRWLTKPVAEAFEKQKQFISDAGHELKTPLTVVKSSLDMLEEETGSSKYIDYIRNENNLMTELTYDLLYLSNMEMQQEKNNLVSMNLSHAAEGTCLPMEALMFEQGFQFECKTEENVMITGEEKQICKMLEIFLDNAMKHTYAGGSIQVTVTKEKSKAVLRIQNDGDPIPEEEQKKIFDRFYRGDKSRERSVGRYGLGLAIASRIAQIHKATINVECKNKKTIFSVSFPQIVN